MTLNSYLLPTRGGGAALNEAFGFGIFALDSGSNEEPNRSTEKGVAKSTLTLAGSSAKTEAFCITTGGAR